MEAKQYRKKPVVIDAVQLTEENRAEVARWIEVGGGTVVSPWSVLGLEVSTIEGDMLAAWGWWVIRGVQGEHYPCKPDIFEATYEPID